eukprot:Pgem_evm1s11052
MTGIETVEELKCSENLLKNETYYNPKTDHYLTWLSSPTMPSLSTLIGVHNYTTQMKVGAYQQIQNHSSIIKTIYKQFNDEYYSFNQSKFSKQFLDQPTVLLKQQKAVKGCYLHLYEESLSQSLNVSMGVKKLLSFFNGSYSISNVYKEVVEVKMENNELKYKDACADMSSDKKYVVVVGGGGVGAVVVGVVGVVGVVVVVGGGGGGGGGVYVYVGFVGLLLV